MLKKFAALRRQGLLWWSLLLFVAANGLLFIPALPNLRYIAALILLTFLPGWVWLHALLFPPPDGPEQAFAPLDTLERAVLAAGFSLALTIITMMLVVYLPGTIDFSQLLITLDIILLFGLVILWRRGSVKRRVSGVRHPSSGADNIPPFRLQPSSLILLPVLLLLLAAALRLPHLGYAEFHEDEAEALMLGVRMMQGEDYALFLHRKGPAQMLVPLAFWLLTGQISEAMARFPFALSSILSVYTIFALGRRWFNGWAGFVAALLWAVNGYAIAFGRMVQYQALIFFLGPLALYCLYWAGWPDNGVTRRQGGKWQVLGAILLAVCLLAHFDALMLLPAAAFLGLAGLRRRDIPATLPPFWHSSRLWGAIIALLVFAGLLAAFYVPYLLDPEFKNTAEYLVGSRVKPGLLYNNLNLLRHLDQIYSSRFYLPLLVVGLISMAAWSMRQSIRRKFGVETVAAWLMFGAGFVGYTFLVDDPRTHLYIMYPGAALLAGAGWESIKSQVSGAKLIRFLAIVLFAAALCFVVVYEIMIFLPTESTLSRLRQEWAGSPWETIYANLPPQREYFGYPKHEGWKAIGALRAQGLFPGDFRSVNEDFIVPIWYNYGQARSCYDTPSQFFVRAPGIDTYIPVQQIERYNEVAWVQREGETRLRVFSAKNLPGSFGASGKMEIYQLEDLADTFDDLSTPARFIQQADPSHPMQTQFGPAIEFRGFDLPQTGVAPGEILYLNLYWRALQAPGDAYRTFVHLTDGSNLWGQQDDDPACRLPTSIWRAGQRGLGQFRLPIKPETPPGRYPLIIGLYQADTLERLKITAGAGKTGDDFLWLGDIEVKAK